MSAKKTVKAPKTTKDSKTREPRPVPQIEGQSAKLAHAVFKLGFLSRLIQRSLSGFKAAPGAEEIATRLDAARAEVEASIAAAKKLPAGFRFGAGGAGFVVGANVTMKEKVAGRYGTALSGTLTVKEIGPGMVQVANEGNQIAWVPRGHLTRPAA